VPTAPSSSRPPRTCAHQAILDAYAGLHDKHIAFALALILDELARHYRDLDEQLRAHVLDCCRSVLDHPESSV
jgi:hypothetical protein